MAFIRLPLARCGLFGATAALAGYLLSLALATVGGVGVTDLPVTTAESSQSVGAAVESLSDPVTAGWLWYNAQIVPTLLPVTDPEIGMVLTSRNLLLAGGGLPLVLLAVAPGLLVAAGYLTARLGVTPGANGARNAGAAVAVGYFPVAVIGAFLLTAPATQSQLVASPSGIRAILSGAVFPLVFGALGGRLGDSG